MEGIKKEGRGIYTQVSCVLFFFFSRQSIHLPEMIMQLFSICLSTCNFYYAKEIEMGGTGGLGWRLIIKKKVRNL